MLKSSSSASQEGCLPVSSNCVIWQGPCLECIDLETGDNVSTVIARMATELCAIQTQFNLTDLDLKCLYDASTGSSTPDKKLSSVLALLIEKVCELEDNFGSTPGTTTPVTDAVVVATCFQTTDLNGDLVTSLSQLDYLRAIGLRVCTIFSTVNSHTATLTNHETRITAIETQGAAEFDLPLVTPSCVLPGNSPEPMNEVLEALEEQFCELRGIVGSVTDLSQSIGKQCVNLNTSPSLSTTSNMSAIAGWKPVVSTVADSLNNMWLTICDIREALKDLKTVTGKTCSDVVVNFLANITENGGAIDLFFSGYTILPAGFQNCAAQGSKLTITDGQSGVHVIYVDLPGQSTSSVPLRIELNTTPLSPSGSFTFTLDSCVTDGSLTCNKTIVVQASGNAMSCSAPAITSVVLT